MSANMHLKRTRFGHRKDTPLLVIIAVILGGLLIVSAWIWMMPV